MLPKKKQKKKIYSNIFFGFFETLHQEKEIHVSSLITNYGEKRYFGYSI
jgi:hypothetical protein